VLQVIAKRFWNGYRAQIHGPIKSTLLANATLEPGNGYWKTPNSKIGFMGLGRRFGATETVSVLLV
jgi:hypothetical protein